MYKWESGWPDHYSSQAVIPSPIAHKVHISGDIDACMLVEAIQIG